MKRDRKKLLTFISMHSQEGSSLMENHEVTLAMDTFVFIEGSSSLIRSDAVLAIAKKLGGFWLFLCVFYLIPRVLRDWVYSVLARNRYRWFGGQKSCNLPLTQENPSPCKAKNPQI